MPIRTHQYRLYPSRKDKRRIFESFDCCKNIYNHLLDLSKIEYQKSGKSLRKFDFDKIVKTILVPVHSQVKQNVSDRVHKSFQNFFRRIKDPSVPKNKKGYPRFKNRVQSITFPQSGYKFLSQNNLYVSKIGTLPIVLHRAMKGKIKTLTIKRNRADQYHAFFTCDIPDKTVKHSGPKVGIDVGIESFATLSDGTFIDNPRHLLKSEPGLKLFHRRLSRKKKGSNNRRKARFILSRKYLKISNQRSDFAHKLSHQITKKYSFISVENLSVKDMLKNHIFAKRISDASWSNFFQYLEYKAVTSGSRFVKVPPHNTSKTCSECGKINESLSLSDRQFICPFCGFSCHRDLNAAINILMIGRDTPESDACGHRVRPSFGKAVVVEAGTICRCADRQSTSAGSPPL